MCVVDANIVLRYVLDDHAELSPKAAKILEQYAVTLPMEAACEVVYVQNTCPLGLTQAVGVKGEQLINQRCAGHMAMKNG